MFFFGMNAAKLGAFRFHSRGRGLRRFQRRPLAAVVIAIGCARSTALAQEQAGGQEAPGREAAARVQDTKGIHPAYELVNFRPSSFNPRVAGMDFLADGTLVVASWDEAGSVFLVDKLDSEDASQVRVRTFARGLWQPFGLRVVQNRVYVLQKTELTELMDEDQDGVAETYRAAVSGWKASGKTHEAAYGLAYAGGKFFAFLAPAFDAKGNLAGDPSPKRGRAINMDASSGKWTFAAEGIRQAFGMSAGPADQVFFIDTIGPFVGPARLHQLTPDAFYGFRVGDTAAQTADIRAPLAWLPTGSGPQLPTTPVAVPAGPFKENLLFGDRLTGEIRRVFLDNVGNQINGCVLPFATGLETGVFHMIFDKEGNLYAGGFNLGEAGSRVAKPDGLQKLRARKDADFLDIKAVKLDKDGMHVVLTAPLTSSAKGKLGGLSLEALKYDLSKFEAQQPSKAGSVKIAKADLSGDRTSIDVKLEGVQAGSVLHVSLPDGLESDTKAKLWSREFWYTANAVP